VINQMSFAATHIQCAIESLLHAHALANKYAVNGREHTAKSAIDWFDRIEKSIKAAKEDLKNSLASKETTRE
jgi:hypothetical protein